MSPFRLFSRWRIARETVSIGTSVSPHPRYTHTRWKTANTSFTYISFSKRRLTIPSLSPRIHHHHLLSRAGELPRRGVSETWIYTKDDRSLRDVFLSPRHKSCGEKLCVHEIKMMHSFENDSKQTWKRRSGGGGGIELSVPRVSRVRGT